MVLYPYTEATIALEFVNCAIDKDINVEVGGLGSTNSTTISFGAVEPPTPPGPSSIADAAVVGAIASLAVFVLSMLIRPQVVSHAQDQKIVPRKLGRLTWHLGWAARSAKVRLSTPLRGLGSAWKLDESPMATLTVVTGAFIPLLATSEPFAALLGLESSDLLVMALVAAVGGLIGAAAPLIVRIFATMDGVPTVGGLYGAGATIVFGALWQIAGVTSEALRLIQENMSWLESLACLIATLLTAAVLAYAVRTLYALVKTKQLADSQFQLDAATLSVTLGQAQPRSAVI